MGGLTAARFAFIGPKLAPQSAKNPRLERTHRSSRGKGKTL